MSVKLHTKSLRKVREFSNLSHNTAQTEIYKRDKAIRRIAKEESVEYKVELAQRQCIQPLHKLEKDWENACKAKVKDEKKIEEAREQVLRGLDKAAVDSISRIMESIKITHLNSNEIHSIELDMGTFYESFKKFVKQNFANYIISEGEYEQIVSLYKTQNVSRIKQLGEKFGYTKPADKLVENLEIVKNASVKQNELSL